MNLIVAVDQNWGIGCDNKLLVSIPDDKKFFRETTKGKVVVMGRKTLESLPGGRPLKERTNIVLTGNLNYKAEDTIVVHSMEELLEELTKYPREDIYVIGGESVYRSMLPYCNTAHITKINYAYRADTHFPNIEEDPQWQLVADSEEQTYFDLEYHFYKYERKSERKILTLS
ncbi:MAG: dihydrofolate reductase [Lachnospiraceae bacterium]